MTSPWRCGSSICRCLRQERAVLQQCRACTTSGRAPCLCSMDSALCSARSRMHHGADFHGNFWEVRGVLKRTSQRSCPTSLLTGDSRTKRWTSQKAQCSFWKKCSHKLGVFRVWGTRISTEQQMWIYPNVTWFPTSSLWRGHVSSKLPYHLEILFQIIFEIILTKLGMLWSSCRAHMWQQSAHTENTEPRNPSKFLRSPSTSPPCSEYSDKGRGGRRQRSSQTWWPSVARPRRFEGFGFGDADLLSTS